MEYMNLHQAYLGFFLNGLYGFFKEFITHKSNNFFHLIDSFFSHMISQCCYIFSKECKEGKECGLTLKICAFNFVYCRIREDHST